MRLRLVLVFLAVGAAACVSHLPDQDLRITTAQPAAKLSASDLWKDFQADAKAARSRYFGAAVDVSDSPTAVEPQAPGGARMVFSQGGDRGVVARLLDDRAAETLKEAKAGTRLTLRCFCEGIDGSGDVLLKSCIRP
ncbi:MAG TPA: hypothetical protein VN700_15200 [Vicinamibacterales bacterium]|nr:hypothetical protein [Vicinamibacterales bacterium]